jgi:transposase
MTTESRTKKPKPAPTIWRVSDEIWAQIQPLLPPPKPKKKLGRPRADDRIVLDGILYVLRTGIQWKQVPKQFYSGSTCHLRFSQWVQAGVFAKLWAALLRHYDWLVLRTLRTTDRSCGSDDRRHCFAAQPDAGDRQRISLPTYSGAWL